MGGGPDRRWEQPRGSHGLIPFRSLGDLIRAVLALLEGAEEARAAWEEEPGEYRWVFQRSASDVRTRLLAFPDVYDDAPDEKGTLLLDATCSARDLGQAIASGAQRVLDEVGSEEYQRRWVEHPFPAADLSALAPTASPSRLFLTLLWRPSRTLAHSRAGRPSRFSALPGPRLTRDRPGAHPGAARSPSPRRVRDGGGHFG